MVSSREEGMNSSSISKAIDKSKDVSECSQRRSAKKSDPKKKCVYLNTINENFSKYLYHKQSFPLNLKERYHV